MSFEQQFGLYIVGIVVIAALVLYGVHRLTRDRRYTAVRADLRDRGHTATVPSRSHRGVRTPSRAAIPRPVDHRVTPQTAVTVRIPRTGRARHAVGTSAAPPAGVPTAPTRRAAS